MSPISQHLARLRADELVATRRESQTIHYSIASEPAKVVIETLYELFCSPATPKTPVEFLRSAHHDHR